MVLAVTLFPDGHCGVVWLYLKAEEGTLRTFSVLLWSLYTHILIYIERRMVAGEGGEVMVYPCNPSNSGAKARGL